MLQSFTEYYRVLQSITEYYRVLQSSTEYYRVVQSITEYNRVLQSNTKYYKEESSASTWTNFRGLLFLNLAKIHTSIPRYQGGGVHSAGNLSRKYCFTSSLAQRKDRQL